MIVPSLSAVDASASGNFGISFLLEIVGIVVVGALIWRYIAPPLNKAMNKRLDTIKGQLLAGDEARAEALRIVGELREALEAAKLEAVQIVQQANRSAEFLVNDGVRRAEEEYGRIVSRIEHEIEAARSRARQEVLSELGAVVVVATEVVVRAELDATSHHRLIDEAIAATESESIDTDHTGAVV
ncbi:MAG TPA: F0F1 ATP synthase subunit B [Acidimicrobiales bacterium]|nr:F0F1 ATP synthase subunit B [Acidimicrobiales bacterium]